jgi:hypothetical protein
MTEAGRGALGYYHERRDESADAFGYLAIAYDEPPARRSSRD